MDIRKIKTKRAIREEFLKLLKSKPIEEITVTELSKNAEIGRMTFYLHYNDIYDLHKSMEEEFLQELQNIFKNKEIDKEGSIKNRISAMVDYLYNNKEEFRLIFTRNKAIDKIAIYSTEIFIEEFYKDNNGDYAKIDVGFIAFGVTGIMAYWLEEDMGIKKEDFERMLLQVISKFMQIEF